MIMVLLRPRVLKATRIIIVVVDRKVRRIVLPSLAKATIIVILQSLEKVVVALAIGVRAVPRDQKKEVSAIVPTKNLTSPAKEATAIPTPHPSLEKEALATHPNLKREATIIRPSQGKVATATRSSQKGGNHQA